MIDDAGHAVLRTVSERFATADPELPNGFAEHAPMGAEALLQLGCAPEDVARWAGRHDPAPLAPEAPVARERDAVLREIAGEGWAAVVASRVARLAPHLGAHLFHGVIRTAHAVRTIAAVDDEWSRRELATAIAAWTVWSDTRSDAAPTGSGDRSTAAPPLAAVPSLTAATDPTERVVDAARRGARAFVAAPSIIALHAVTGPMALHLLAEHLDAPTLAAGADALERTHRRHPAVDPGQVAEVPPLSRSELDGLTTRWDAHPAKLVEAALRAHRTTGDPIFPAAASAVVR